MIQHIIKRDGALDLKVSGILAAEASSRKGKAPRWTEIRLYRAQSGKFVVAVDKLSELPGEKNIHEAWVCESAEEVIESLRDHKGHLDRVGKELLRQAFGRDDATITEKVE